MKMTDPEIPTEWVQLKTGDTTMWGDRMWDGQEWRFLSKDAADAGVTVLPHEIMIRHEKLLKLRLENQK